MRYRDELTAAQRRIDQLEGEVARLERSIAGDDRVRTLEAELARLTAPPAGFEAVATYAKGVGAGLALYLGAFLFVVNDHDATAWGLANASLLAMVVGSVVGPFPHRETAARLVGAAFKALVLLVWASGWWALEHHELPRAARQASFAFFWYAPAVTFALTVVEALALRRWSAYRS